MDIDGVLNHHREHFCKLLKAQTGKELSPDAITVIPVHLIPGCDVTEADEHAVFNWPMYWTDMPVVSGAVEALAQLRSTGTRILIFTSRQWPRPTTFPIGREDIYRSAWQAMPDIVQITEGWLRRHRLPYDDLTVEAGADHQKTRFVAVQEQAIPSFVEDNLENARKLATHCERVFLIDQPYNQTGDGTLPGNIVRVRSWEELLEAV